MAGRLLGRLFGTGRGEAGQQQTATTTHPAPQGRSTHLDLPQATSQHPQEAAEAPDSSAQHTSPAAGQEAEQQGLLSDVSVSPSEQAQHGFRPQQAQHDFQPQQAQSESEGRSDQLAQHDQQAEHDQQTAAGEEKSLEASDEDHRQTTALTPSSGEMRPSPPPFLTPQAVCCMGLLLVFALLQLLLCMNCQKF